MILVSFFLEDNVLSDEIKHAIFSNIKVTKIERSALFGTPGILPCIVPSMCGHSLYDICFQVVGKTH